MNSGRNSLPKHWEFTRPIQASPLQLFDFLSDLYRQELQNDPNDSYLAHHGSQTNVIQKIYSFRDYAPFLPKHGRILDWGCNHAPDSSLLKAAFGDSLELHACDFRAPHLFPHFIQASSAQYIQLTEAIKLPYPNEYFQGVVASGALEHVAFDYRSLEELHRILVPGGILIINYLPNRYSYHEWIQETLRKADFHMRRYTLASASQLLKSNGFFPIQSGYQTYIWEQKLARLGIQKRSWLTRLFYGVLPIHLLGGCIQLVATKQVSMK